MITRHPAVANQFYPSSKIALLQEIEGFIEKKSERKDIIAAILPHAGIMYSGSVAGAVVSQISPKETIVIIGPNHSGLGKPFSIMTDGTWRTPLGDIDIDVELAEEINSNSRYLENDSLAHQREHSIEVELPFFQYIQKDFKIVPILVFSDNKQVYENIADAIAKAIKNTSKQDKVLIVGSSDLTHYEAQQIAEEKDKAVIESIIKLDEASLLKNVKELSVSMCGCGPVIIAITAAKQLGAKSAELVKYQTSADVSGNCSSVVGYAGITIF